MATRVDENSHPALRPGGRNSNPLVANVFPSAFTIQNFLQAARQTVARHVTELSRSRGTGKRTRDLLAVGQALYHVVLRAFAPLQNILKEQKIALPAYKRTDKFVAETLQFVM